MPPLQLILSLQFASVLAATYYPITEAAAHVEGN